MFRYLIILFALLLSFFSSLHAEDNYCYQKPEKCLSGDILILTISEDVAKYCDFDKQIIGMTRHTTSRSFNNQEVVCVKATMTREKLK